MTLLLTLSGQKAKELREHSKFLNPYFFLTPCMFFQIFQLSTKKGFFPMNDLFLIRKTP
jgi:hypothetical protein